MKKQIQFIPLLIFLLIPLLSLAQEQVQVRGKVTDAETGDPLPGVTILVDKSTRGVTTDMDGTFEIRVTPADKLVFSFLGMVSQTVEVGDQRYIEVALVTTASELEEVTILPLGYKRRE